LKLLTIDFPMDGPWGAEMSEAYTGLAEKINEARGLVWKIWLENRETGEQGGAYLFEDAASLDAYLREHTERLKALGVENVRVKTFDVNEPLTRLNHGLPEGK
jgi:hypothetical protein